MSKGKIESQMSKVDSSLKICILARSTTFHNKSGGLETQNKTLCEGLAKKGCTVIVISTLFHLQGGRVESGYVRVGGVNYYFINAPSGVYSTKWWKESCIKFKELDNKYKFDVVISQSSAGKSVFQNAQNFRKIAVCHGTALGELKSRFKSLKTPRNLIRFILKDIAGFIGWYIEDILVFKNADRIVCVSKILKDSVVREYPIFAAKIVVIDNGVDVNKFSKINFQFPEGKDFTLLYVGRVVREKGIEVLLKSLANLISPMSPISPVLLVVGGGSDLEFFKRRARELKVEEIVKFVGEVNNEDVVKYYNMADVFVYPSLRQEGFPMVLAEAMVAGLPIIASRIGGIPSVVENEKTGLLIEPGNVQNLVSAILKLHKDPTLRETLSSNAKIKALRKYSQETMVSKYLKVV